MSTHPQTRFFLFKCVFTDKYVENCNISHGTSGQTIIKTVFRNSIHTWMLNGVYRQFRGSAHLFASIKKTTHGSSVVFLVPTQGKQQNIMQKKMVRCAFHLWEILCVANTEDSRERLGHHAIRTKYTEVSTIADW